MSIGVWFLLGVCAVGCSEQAILSGSDAGQSADRDVSEVVTTLDASVEDAALNASRDAGKRDAAGYSDAGACGLCDRVWVCNGLAQMWKTESDGRCVNQINRTALRCDGTLDGAMYSDLGTWTGDAQEVALHFRDLNGGTRTYYCYPQ